MASHEPDRYLSGALVQAVAYSGTGVTPTVQQAYQRDAQDITGPLDQQIFKACDFVRKNMRVAARKMQVVAEKICPNLICWRYLRR